MEIPLRSPRATSVLKTCSGGKPILAATVSAARSSGSTWYSRSSNFKFSDSSKRTALVFMFRMVRQSHTRREFETVSATLRRFSRGTALAPFLEDDQNFLQALPD